VRAFSNAIKLFRRRAKQAVPSHLPRTTNRDGAGFGDGQGSATPMLQASTGRQTYLRRPLPRASVWQPRALGWKGAIGRRLRLTARRNTGRKESRKQRRADRRSVSSARPTPCCGAGWQRQAVAEGEASRSSPAAVLGRGPGWHATTGVLVLEARFPCYWALAPSRPPEGGLVIHRGRARSGSAGGPGCRCSKPLRQPAALGE